MSGSGHKNVDIWRVEVLMRGRSVGRSVQLDAGLFRAIISSRASGHRAARLRTRYAAHINSTVRLKVPVRRRRCRVSAAARYWSVQRSIQCLASAVVFTGTRWSSNYKSPNIKWMRRLNCMWFTWGARWSSNNFGVLLFLRSCGIRGRGEHDWWAGKPVREALKSCCDPLSNLQSPRMRARGWADCCSSARGVGGPNTGRTLQLRQSSLVRSNG